jgi:Domain of Unknown Function (DUF748)
MLLFARRALLACAKSFLTRKLNESSNFEGSFEEIDFRLFQGRAALRGVHITTLSQGRRVVKAHCREVSIHVQWRDLLHGTLVGRVRLRKPHIEIFADRESDRGGKPQTDALLALCRETQRFMPFRLRSLEVSEGSIEYVSQFTSPSFKLALDKISISAANLTNIASSALAHIFAEGRITRNGRFWMQLTLPSPSDALTFDLQAGLNRVNLVDLNDVLRAFAKFDVKRGNCSIHAEFNVEQGRYQGFVQPRFQDLDVFAWQKDHGKGLFQICRQAAIAFLAALLKNQPRDELALNIPISGTFDDPDVDTWAAVGSLLRNMFVRSLLPRSAENGSGTEMGRWSRLRFWKRRHSPC